MWVGWWWQWLENPKLENEGLENVKDLENLAVAEGAAAAAKTELA